MGAWRTAVLGVTVSLSCAASSAATLASEAWGDFYRPTEPAQRTAQQQPITFATDASSVCLLEIFEAQIRHDIPGNLLLAIGLQEAGRRVDGTDTVWPWTANAVGTGAFLRDKAGVKAWVRSRQADGVQSIDVGCMQINLHWHGRAFRDLDHALDPRENVDYAARFLVRLKQETGSWWEAAGRYHSATERYKTAYLAKLVQNQERANQGLGDIADLVIAASNVDPESPPKITVPPPDVHWTANIAPGDEGGSVGYHSIYTVMPIRNAFFTAQAGEGTP
ncbi:MAG: lytic transglycosylase domain-containing protein [Rhodobacteraceae bacterium]|nr:lytic transglycosylase domain-containing protein [Paracoccaceae bacterium]